MAIDPLRSHYLAAAYGAVVSTTGRIQSLAPMSIMEIAADAAVITDRHRMAEQLRNRVIQGKASGMSNSVAMAVEELLFDLADQIAEGMPFTPEVGGGGR